jgi:hypothetical protein
MKAKAAQQVHVESKDQIIQTPTLIVGQAEGERSVIWFVYS